METQLVASTAIHQSHNHNFFFLKSLLLILHIRIFTSFLPFFTCDIKDRHRPQKTRWLPGIISRRNTWYQTSRNCIDFIRGFPPLMRYGHFASDGAISVVFQSIAELRSSARAFFPSVFIRESLYP
jgi:hypothetical protein